MRRENAARLHRFATILAVLAGGAHIVESALIATGTAPWPGGARDAAGAAIVATVGIAGTVAALAGQRRSRVLAIVTIAGVVSVVFDLGAPYVAVRMVPGLLLLLSGGLGAVAVAARTSRELIREGLWRWVAWGFVTVHALLLLPLLTLGLVVPMAAVFSLMALWTVGVVLALRALPDHPQRVPAVPIAFAVTAVAAIQAGGAFLGWGA